MLLLPQRQASSFDSRNIIWAKGIEAGSTKPILGWGLENFELAFKSTLKPAEFDLKNIRVDKAHNEFLEIFVNSGAVGLTLYIGLVILALIRLRYNHQVMLGLIGYLIVASLNVVNINEYLFFYLALGLSNIPLPSLSSKDSKNK